MRLAGFLLLSAAFALAAWLGWWTVPVLGLGWGLLRPAVAHPVRWAALAAAAGWSFWLLVDLGAGHGGLGRLAGRLGGVLHLPAAGLIAATLLFPLLLGWSAAAIGHRLAGYLTTARR